MRLLRAVLPVAAAIVLPLASCREVVAPAELEYVGSWHLMRINGQELPFVTALSAGSRSDILGADIVLNANGTMETSTTSKTTVGNTSLIETDGTRGRWTLAGKVITLSANGATLDITITRRELSYDVDGYAMIFTR